MDKLSQGGSNIDSLLIPGSVGKTSLSPGAKPKQK